MAGGAFLILLFLFFGWGSAALTVAGLMTAIFVFTIIGGLRNA